MQEKNDDLDLDQIVEFKDLTPDQDRESRIEGLVIEAREYLRNRRDLPK
jgi:hypothetical protein